MIINRAYINITNKNDRNIINQILEEFFNEIEITWNNDIGMISTINKESFHLQLSKFLSTVFLDFNIQLSVLIVPFFYDIFLKYFSKMNNEVCSAFEIFLRNINEQFVKKDATTILNSINKNDLDTLDAFLKCNANSCVTANELFIHRNTFNYRVNHLNNETNIDIRDLNSLMFLKLIINICA